MMRQVYIHKQSGAVLVMSLVLLTVMTLIGIATMSGSSMEMRVASNMQQHNIAFQGAQSRIEFAASSLSPANPINFRISIPDLDNPPVQPCDVVDNCLDGADWAATATVNYKGCVKGYGESLESNKGISHRTFEINATATTTGGVARSLQGQGVRIPVKACGDEET